MKYNKRLYQKHTREKRTSSSFIMPSWMWSDLILAEMFLRPPRCAPGYQWSDETCDKFDKIKSKKEKIKAIHDLQFQVLMMRGFQLSERASNLTHKYYKDKWGPFFEARKLVNKITKLTRENL